VKLFLDSSVVLAACGRPGGASRFVIDSAESRNWTLQISSYVLQEVKLNIHSLGSDAINSCRGIVQKVEILRDVVTFPWISVFPSAKDRPILFTAAAWSEVLLTLDRRDFVDVLGKAFYGLIILKPGDFIRQQREATT
jgi:predicted nucleic acid-binding protein